MTIATTHAGSLPRPPGLVAALNDLSRDSTDVGAADRVAALVDEAVVRSIDRQRAVGIDIGNDGEQGRESFFTYVRHRMTGFGAGEGTSRTWTDMSEYPDFLELRRSQLSGRRRVDLARPPQAVGEIRYGSTGAVDADCQRLAEHPFARAFMTSASPGIIVCAMADRFYDNRLRYLDAVGSALAVEYKHIVDSGLLLQIDAPDLAMERHTLFGDQPLPVFLEFAEQVVEVINRALDGLPPEQVRLHVCWGNYEGPHVHDTPLAELLPVLYQASVGGLLVSGANPRHEHEYREFERQPLPDSWTLATGVIDTTTNYVEHPQVVADRIDRVVEAVGDPTRVLACTDCGFDTSAGFGVVAEDVAWAKMDAMVRGAELSSERWF
jgi:5-methyltetrahydropteroyltriglutamate--homocysteine methyltransferase